ncbi:MAG: molecular chaperone HtpG [Burkholderiaceae bacterium]|jgi:molecular chaperone HtpG
MDAVKETRGFQAEVKQLLQLMIHSLYSNKEIFLRELISNASDACDKLRFEAINQAGLFENDSNLRIRVSYDKAARTLTLSDNGIGLSRQEAIDHLGTIAKSGTREFFGQLSGDQQKDAALIGQFGVGFYSAFIVADRVRVESRRAGLDAGEGVRWESDASGEFTVETIEQSGRGTHITLHLREGEDEWLTGWKLKSVLTKYSDHISLPIEMPREEWDEAAGGMKTLDEWEVVNKASALWGRPKSDITEEEYHEFYKNLTYDNQAPLAYTHNRVEGRSEYTQLLYVPAHAPFDLWDRNQAKGVKLYVKRVFIMDEADQLLPQYLRFVRGVIDSADLPLNVSREILQESRDVRAIREGSAKKVLALLEELADQQPEKYASFWREFGQLLKEGMHEDVANKDRIAPLLRFASTHLENAEHSVSLKDYVERMKVGQDKIYYITADTEQGARHSPHLEIFNKKGIEVLLLTDRVDEWMLAQLTEFQGKTLQSVAKGGVDLGVLEDEADKAVAEKAADEYKDVLERIQAVLQSKVKETRVTLRLTDSPACIVADEHDMSNHLQRLLKQAGQKMPSAKPILEINPEHALIQRLKTDETNFEALAQVIFDQAVLAEGGQLDDPTAFVKRINALLIM